MKSQETKVLNDDITSALLTLNNPTTDALQSEIGSGYDEEAYDSETP